MMSKGNNFIVTEYIDGGDLRSILIKEKKAMVAKNPLLDIASYPAALNVFGMPWILLRAWHFYIQKIYSSRFKIGKYNMYKSRSL